MSIPIDVRRSVTRARSCAESLAKSLKELEEMISVPEPIRASPPNPYPPDVSLMMGGSAFAGVRPPGPVQPVPPIQPVPPMRPSPSDVPRTTDGCGEQSDVICTFTFESMLPDPVGTALDSWFVKEGWELQVRLTGWGIGYQIHRNDAYGEDEWAFPHLYDTSMLLAFAQQFYQDNLAGSSEGGQS